MTDIRKYGGQTEMAHCKIAKRKELLLENSTYSVKISFQMNFLRQRKTREFAASRLVLKKLLKCVFQRREMIAEKNIKNEEQK